jgi:hypothetical protein
VQLRVGADHALALSDAQRVRQQLHRAHHHLRGGHVQQRAAPLRVAQDVRRQLRAMRRVRLLRVAGGGAR